MTTQKAETPKSRPMYSPPMPPKAFALRVWYATKDDAEILNYDAVTFPRAPFHGCEQTVRRLAAFGMIADGYTGYAVDAIDENHDILETWGLTHKGIQYMRRFLKLRREVRESADVR